MSFINKSLENLGKQQDGFINFAGTGAATVVGGGTHLVGSQQVNVDLSKLIYLQP